MSICPCTLNNKRATRSNRPSPPEQNPAAAQTTGLFSLPPGAAAAAGAAPAAAAAVQNPLAAAIQSPTGNPLLDAYSQYAALAAAGYTAAAAGNGLDMAGQQQQQTGEKACFLPGLEFFC